MSIFEPTADQIEAGVWGPYVDPLNQEQAQCVAGFLRERDERIAELEERLGTLTDPHSLEPMLNKAGMRPLAAAQVASRLADQFRDPVTEGDDSHECERMRELAQVASQRIEDLETRSLAEANSRREDSNILVKAQERNRNAQRTCAATGDTSDEAAPDRRAQIVAESKRRFPIHDEAGSRGWMVQTNARNSFRHGAEWADAHPDQQEHTDA